MAPGSYKMSGVYTKDDKQEKIDLELIVEEGGTISNSVAGLYELNGVANDGNLILTQKFPDGKFTEF